VIFRARRSARARRRGDDIAPGPRCGPAGVRAEDYRPVRSAATRRLAALPTACDHPRGRAWTIDRRQSPPSGAAAPPHRGPLDEAREFGLRSARFHAGRPAGCSGRRRGPCRAGCSTWPRTGVDSRESCPGIAAPGFQCHGEHRRRREWQRSLKSASRDGTSRRRPRWRPRPVGSCSPVRGGHVPNRRTSSCATCAAHRG